MNEYCINEALVKGDRGAIGIDRPDGNQFIVRIWRTAQKDEVTTQRANEELFSATQKDENTTPKRENTIPKPLTTTPKAI